MKKVNRVRTVGCHRRYLRNSLADMISILLLIIIMYYAFS